MQNASDNRNSLLTVRVNVPSLKNPLNNPNTWFLLLVAILGLFIWREFLRSNSAQWETTAPTSLTNQGPPLLSTIMMKGTDAAGNTFTITSPRQVHINFSIKQGSHIVINRYKGSIVYTLPGPDFDGEEYFEPGQYVVSLISQGKSSASAFVEIR